MRLGGISGGGRLHLAARIYCPATTPDNNTASPPATRLGPDRTSRHPIVNTPPRTAPQSSLLPLRPQNVVECSDLDAPSSPSENLFIVQHSSGFITRPIFALLLITEARCDASGVTPGRRYAAADEPAAGADATARRFL